MDENQPPEQTRPFAGCKGQVIEKNGRSERIRTSDPLVPNEVRYQAALHSANYYFIPDELRSTRTAHGANHSPYFLGSP